MLEHTSVKIPRSLDIENALSLSIELANLPESKKFRIDFGGTRGTVEPFGMLLTCGELLELTRRYPKADFECVNYKHMTYAAHMGFFQAFGLDYGNRPGQASGSARYIPITILYTEEIIRQAAEAGDDPGDVLDEHAKRLATTLCGENEGRVVDTLAYSMRELMRNVVEHSGAPRFGLCAQFWPTKGKAEVAILDHGMGLRRSLVNNPHLDVRDDKAAVNYAQMPAVSGKTFKGAKIRKKGHWANSGFGLYMTSRICRNGGTFCVASGNIAMLLTKGQQKRYFPCHLDGTAARMVVRTDQLEALSEALQRFRAEGYEIQKMYEEIVNIDPSSASLMLSEEFDRSTLQRVLTRIRG